MHKVPLLPTYHWHIKDGCPVHEPLFPAMDMRGLSIHDIFYVAYKDITDVLKRPISAIGADILEVGISAFLADCLSPRKFPKGERASFRSAWKRDMSLITPVRKLSEWQGSASLLNEAIEFATGDSRWLMGFVSREGEASVCETRSFNPYSPSFPVRICLFSEGIDSFCGIAKQMELYPQDHFFAVSAVMQTRIQPMLERSVGLLNKEFGNRLHHIPVHMNRLGSDAEASEESSQRTRSLLLLLLGTVIALTLDQDEVEIYENGLECFGFPCSPLALSAQESRAMHPIFLHRLSKWIAELTGNPFHFVAPNLFKTKGNILKELPEQLGAELCKATVSCMHFPQRRKGVRQCGSCSGCILRRLAFQWSGLSDAHKDYRREVSFNRNPNSPFADSDFCQMRGQVNALNLALQRSECWDALIERSGVEADIRYIEFEEAICAVSGVPHGEARLYTIHLFEQYIREWESVYGMDSTHISQ